MVAYLERMPAGIPGEVSRWGHATLESNEIGSAPVPFGAAVKIVAGKTVALAEGDTADAIYGFLARSYPTQGGGTGFSDTETAVAPAGSLQSVMRRGYMSVLLKSGAGARNGQVYVRVTAVDGKAVGDIEAAPGAGLVATPSCTFMGPADAGGNVEISYNI